MKHTHARYRRGLTLIEVAIVVSLLLVFAVLVFVSTTNRGCYLDGRMKNSSQLRGWQQSAVIFAQSNGFYLPGLDASGNVLADGPRTTGGSGDGSTVEARLWVLLQGQFIPAEMMANPQESLSAKWTSNAVTQSMYSYAMLRLGSTNTDAGRRAEWKDNANSDVVLLSDRNTGSSVAPAAVRSLWTTTPGDWKGHIVWGDNHAEYSASHTGLKTHYLSSSSTNDNLFLDERETAGSNALMVR